MPKYDNESLIDTSRMSEGERAALEATEAAREAASMERTFAGGLFLGRHDLSQIMPFPEQTMEDRDQGDAFLSRLEDFLASRTDPDGIDETGAASGFRRQTIAAPPCCSEAGAAT